MSQIIRICAVISAALWLPAVPAMAQTASPPTISVTGEATVSAKPDLAQIDGGVTTDAKTARAASEANNAIMGKILLALKGAGLAPKDYQTSQLSLQPQYTSNANNRNGPNVLTGYRASSRVTITVRDIGNLGKVIDTLVANGANDIGGISFMVSTASKLLDEARPRAIADARRKAEIYAAAAGVVLGPPLRISEGGAPIPMPYRKMSAAVASAPIAPGEETLHLTVSVSWIIKPKP